MNNNAQIEITFITIIIVFQFLIFMYTFFTIIKFWKIFPSVIYFKLVKLLVPKSVLFNTAPNIILNDISKYTSTDINQESHENFEINILDSDKYINSILRKILIAINTYILSNRTAVADFNIIKDVVERNTQIVEEEISLTINIPLYLGLVGTMFGIVYGLFNISDIFSTTTDTINDQNISKGIAMLLSGVKIAMIASFTGLLLTIINSGLFFKISKKVQENRKNEFYTFIQTELLPAVNENMTDTLGILQRNLFKFNDVFSKHLTKLSDIYDKNYESLLAQKDFLETLRNMDISQITLHNLELLKGLNESIKLLDNFNENINKLDSFVENLTQLSSDFIDFINRTSDIKKIASSIDDSLNQSKELFTFLTSHFKILDERKTDFERTIINIDNILSTALDELQNHIHFKINEIRNISIKHNDILESTLKEKRDVLDNLEYLENVNNIIEKVNNNIEVVNNNIRNVNSNFENVNNYLKNVIDNLENIKSLLTNNPNSNQINLDNLNKSIINLNHLIESFPNKNLIINNDSLFKKVKDKVKNILP